MTDSKALSQCRRIGCTNNADMYSRYGLCEKHEKLRARHLTYVLFGRVFAIFEGTLSVIGLISALWGINNWFDEDITFIWNTALFIVGLVIFVRFYRKTRYITFA